MAQLRVTNHSTENHLCTALHKFFFDNGAYGDHLRTQPFDGARWYRDLRRIAYALEFRRLTAPDFIVVPDIVGDGQRSLARSLEEARWVPPELTVRYLVVQEGMSEDAVAAALPQFEGIFVGGAEMSWKLSTAPGWVRLAHGAGKPCHIGRIGTPDRLRWAADIGADSIDSNWPLSTTERLVAFGETAHAVTALARPPC
jgi:hypothetical protein